MPMWWSGGDDTLPAAEVERTAKDVVADVVVESVLLLKDYSAVMIDVDGGDYFGNDCCDVVDDLRCGGSSCNSSCPTHCWYDCHLSRRCCYRCCCFLWHCRQRRMTTYSYSSFCHRCSSSSR